MPTRIRTRLALEAERANREQAVRLGAQGRSARIRRRLTQQQLGDLVGLSQSTVSRAERGLGGGLTLDAWQRLAIAVGIRLHVTMPRDPLEETADAGHLAIQEFVLRLGRAAGFTGTFELPTRPAEPWRSIDVGLVPATGRCLVVVECWNTIGDIGASARASSRKRAEAEAAAAARWGPAARASLVWVVRASARNRRLVQRYPEVFATRFPGSSRRWVAWLTAGGEPPTEDGLVWADVAATRLFEWRR